jgi:ParB-like chromosome segregation protein Spo0J
MQSESKQNVGEYVSTNTLSLHPKNPRNNDMAVDDIANSIQRFGFTSPIVANRDGVVLCGNTRLKASRKLGLDVVPVVYVDLSPTEQELLMIADNKLGERADWNTDSLSSLLSELDSNGANLSGIGFDGDELSSLLDSMTEPVDIDFDETPGDEKKPKLCPSCGEILE